MNSYIRMHRNEGMKGRRPQKHRSATHSAGFMEVAHCTNIIRIIEWRKTLSSSLFINCYQTTAIIVCIKCNKCYTKLNVIVFYRLNLKLI